MFLTITAQRTTWNHLHICNAARTSPGNKFNFKPFLRTFHQTNFEFVNYKTFHDIISKNTAHNAMPRYPSQIEWSHWTPNIFFHYILLVPYVEYIAHLNAWLTHTALCKDLHTILKNCTFWRIVFRHRQSLKTLRFQLFQVIYYQGCWVIYFIKFCFSFV